MKRLGGFGSKQIGFVGAFSPDGQLLATVVLVVAPSGIASLMGSMFYQQSLTRVR